MHYFVNDNCIGCGLCAATCPEVFTMTDAGVAVADTEEPNTAISAKATEAMESCPVDAIESME